LSAVDKIETRSAVDSARTRFRRITENPKSRASGTTLKSGQVGKKRDHLRAVKMQCVCRPGKIDDLGGQVQVLTEIMIYWKHEDRFWKAYKPQHVMEGYGTTNLQPFGMESCHQRNLPDRALRDVSVTLTSYSVSY
jgi:hypothetical protein